MITKIKQAQDHLDSLLNQMASTHFEDVGDLEYVNSQVDLAIQDIEDLEELYADELAQVEEMWADSESIPTTGPSPEEWMTSL